ncbi:MAG: CHAT domain-containing protein [Gemmatimonadetes bacterium]|nr:CHAT domain-containing protein [Gemmatimonadota bacterium]
MDAESLYSTLRSGTPESRQELLDTLPDGGFNQPARLLLESGEPGMAVLAFTQVVGGLCSGVNPAVGAPLALATHRYAVELFEASAGHAGLLPMTLSNIATQYANACNLLGESEATLWFTERWIPYYTRLGERENLPGLKAARINALLNLHRLDDAQAGLEDPTLRGNWATDIEVGRLEKLLKQLRGEITQDKEAAQEAAAGPDAVFPADLQDVLKKMVDQTIDDPEKKRRFQEAVAALVGTPGTADPTDSKSFDQDLDALRRGEQILTRGTTSDSELTIRRKVREASGIFVGGRQPAPKRIRSTLTDLEVCLAWARAQKHTELTRDALWGIYLCQGRLGEPSRAADALLALRADLEADRAGISDPLKRGCVFSRYPHVFSALCEQLQKAGRTPELLEAIEASKGRGVADILTQKAGRSVADASIYAAVGALPELTRKHAFHYVTFHVDDERTYIALVSKAGDIHAIPPVLLGRSAIRETALHADPREWGKSRLPDAAQALAPLVGWIDELLSDGVMVAGDHICYAPDEDLSNVPLQYLPVRRKPLIDFVSLSRIHSAFHLEHVLAGSDGRPERFVAFVVPTRQNTTRESWPEMKRYLREPVEWLEKHLDGDVVEERSATLQRLGAADLRAKILHFSVHGTFPPAQAGRIPFEHSGIVLSPAGELPDEDGLERGELDGVLTPSKVMDLTLDLTGSHVSLMACVSGLSREGLGGDALGIEWAFTQAGAVSLLTSHWNVNAKLAAVFVRRFYEHWLTKRATRAQALVRTVAEFRKQPAPFARPECWAAFSLTGDWR